jgi:hypothetical protein
MLQSVLGTGGGGGEVSALDLFGVAERPKRPPGEGERKPPEGAAPPTKSLRETSLNSSEMSGMNSGALGLPPGVGEAIM